MNLKKILILPVGFLLTNMMYIACCDCKPINKFFYEVINVAVSPSGSGKAIVDNGTPVTVDSLYLDYLFYTNCIAVQKNNFSFLVNTASACSCIGCGEKGLKSKVTSIEITSDNMYNGIAANNSLNNIFKTYNKYNIYNNNSVSIDSMITLINVNQESMSDFNLFTITKPGNTSPHQFTLKAVFVNGKIFTTKTKPIIWQ